MPQLIAEVEQPAAVVARQRLMIPAEVRDVVHQRVKPMLLRLCDIAASRVLDLAEIAGERDLLIVGDVLVVEDEDRVTIHPGLDCSCLVPRQGQPQIHPRDFADENRMDLANGESHRSQAPEHAREKGLCLQKRQKRYADVANLSCWPQPPPN